MATILGKIELSGDCGDATGADKEVMIGMGVVVVVMMVVVRIMDDGGGDIGEIMGNDSDGGDGDGIG